MQDEIILQLLPLVVAGLALLVSLGKAWVGRIEIHTEQEAITAKINLLHEEIESLRERSDIETRELVNQMMQQCVDENHKLLDMIKASEVERTELQAKVESLRLQLDAATRNLVRDEG